MWYVSIKKLLIILCLNKEITIIRIYIYLFITMLRGFSTLDTCYQNNQCPLNSLDDENIVGQPCFLNECNMLLYTIYAYGISTSGMKIPDIPSTTASQTGKNLPPQSPWTCSLLKPVINAPTSLGISASQARMMVPTKLSLDIAISLIF